MTALMIVMMMMKCYWMMCLGQWMVKMLMIMKLLVTMTLWWIILEIDHDNELEHDEIDYNSDESHVHADCEEILIGYEPSACGDNGSDSPIQTTELDAEISTDEFVTELDNNSMTSMNEEEMQNIGVRSWTGFKLSLPSPLPSSLSLYRPYANH